MKIMLYEPFMLNMVWKSTEKFGNLSLESMEFWNGKCAGTLEYRIILTLIPLIIKINVIYCIDYDLSLAAFYGQ